MYTKSVNAFVVNSKNIVFKVVSILIIDQLNLLKMGITTIAVTELDFYPFGL